MEMRIVRRTDRFDDACRFWGELLGCPVTHEWPAGDGQGRGKIFRVRPDTGVEFIEVESAGPVFGLVLGIEVDDADQMYADCMDFGAPIIQPLANQPWAHRNLTVRDPSGIEVTFFHRL